MVPGKQPHCLLARLSPFPTNYISLVLYLRKENGKPGFSFRARILFALSFKFFFPASGAINIFTYLCKCLYLVSPCNVVKFIFGAYKLLFLWLF